jgi:hypothetical protein
MRKNNEGVEEIKEFQQMSVNTRRPSILFHGTVISQTKRQNWDD